MNEQEMSYEASVERLDAIVKKLEKGDAPLDEAIRLFEEGIALGKHCVQLLDTAEQKVVRLVKGEDGAPVEMEFEQDGE